MQALRKILRSHKKKLMSLDNVIGVGIGHKMVANRSTEKKSIIVFVNKKVAPEGLRRGQAVPLTLEGKETDVIETGPFKLLGRTEKVRPAVPGMSIGHYKITAGTFGAVVKDNSTGKLLILSNNHVLANATNGNDDRAKVGDSILQPGVYDSGKMETDVIANLFRFVPIYSLIEESRCPIANAAALGATGLVKMFVGDYRVRFEKEAWTENIVDAALAEPLAEDYIGNSILELGEITGCAEPQLGEVVRKSGRTSGLTHGWVRAVDVTIRVALREGAEAVFNDQSMSNMLSQPGDSGSVVLNEQNQAVGLLFAGSGTMTLFNRFSNVLKLLDVSL